MKKYITTDKHPQLKKGKRKDQVESSQANFIYSLAAMIVLGGGYLIIQGIILIIELWH